MEEDDASAPAPATAAVEAALLRLDAADAREEADAILRRHLRDEMLLPRVQEALQQQQQQQQQQEGAAGGGGVITAEALMHQDPGLASALEAARGQMAAVAERCLMVQQQKEDDAADTEEGRHDDDAWQDVDDEEGGDGVKALAPHGGAESNDGQGFVSLFAMYDMPNVVLVDMGRVAEKLAGAGGEAELQLEGLAQLEGSVLTELSYSEHWPAVCAAVGGLVNAPDARVWRKALKLCWELFSCLTPGQCADTYVAVASGMARVLKSKAPSLPLVVATDAESTVALGGDGAVTCLWEQAQLLHRMQVKMAELLPFLPDAAAARVAAWACLLLRRLLPTAQQQEGSPPAAPAAPALLLSPAHLLALLDPTAHWFGDWSLRLPPGQLAYLLHRTRLLQDLIHRCRPPDLGSSMENTGPFFSSTPVPAATGGGPITHAALAHRLHRASLALLTHALLSWPPPTAATALLLLLRRPRAPALWRKAGVYLTPAQLPAAPTDVIVKRQGPGEDATALAVALKGEAGNDGEEGEGQEQEEEDLCGAVLGLYVDGLLRDPSWMAAAEGLLHLAAGLGRSDTRVLDALDRLIVAAEATVAAAAEAASPSPAALLLLSTGMRLCSTLLQLQHDKKEDEGGSPPPSPPTPVLSSLKRLHALAVTAIIEPPHDHDQREQQQHRQRMCNAFAASLWAAAPYISSPAAAWPTHRLFAPLACADVAQARRAAQCLAPFASTLSGLASLAHHTGAVGAARVVEHLAEQAQAHLEALVAAEEAGDSSSQHGRVVEGHVPFPTVALLLQHAAASGGSTAAALAPLLGRLCAFVFDGARGRYGVRMGEYLAGGSAEQPAALAAHLSLLLALLRPLAAAAAAAGGEGELGRLLVETVLGPCVARLTHPTHDDDDAELSLRLLISAATTTAGAAWLLTAHRSLPSMLHRRLGLLDTATGGSSPSSSPPPIDGPTLAASYLLSLLPIPESCPLLPPPPPFFTPTDEGEEEEAEDNAMREGLAVLAGHAAVVGAGRVGAGWGGTAVHFFEEQLQKPSLPQVKEGGGGGTAVRALIKDVLYSGLASGPGKPNCLRRCWAHVVAAAATTTHSGAPSLSLEGQAAGAAATAVAAPCAPPPPTLEGQAAGAGAAGGAADAIAMHAVKWGLVPHAGNQALEHDLQRLFRSRPRVNPWHLGALAMAACGRVEEVLAVLPADAAPGAASDIHNDSDVHLAVAEAFAAEFPLAAGALERCGLAVGALVLGWVQQAFWGLGLSVTELGIIACLTAVGGKGWGQGCVALALLRHWWFEGGLEGLVPLVVGGRGEVDTSRALDALLRVGNGFEFSPEVAVWMEGAWERWGPRFVEQGEGI